MLTHRRQQLQEYLSTTPAWAAEHAATANAEPEPEDLFLVGPTGPLLPSQLVNVAAAGPGVLVRHPPRWFNPEQQGPEQLRHVLDTGWALP